MVNPLQTSGVLQIFGCKLIYINLHVKWDAWNKGNIMQIAKKRIIKAFFIFGLIGAYLSK